MTILENIKHDIQTIKDRDPAATSTLEILTYSGLHAVAFYRVSHGSMFTSTRSSQDVFRSLQEC